MEYRFDEFGSTLFCRGPQLLGDSIMIDLVRHVKDSIIRAMNGQSKLSEKEFELPGMSGLTGRCFLNNVCSFPGANYLEIGLWKGSTFYSALKGNSITAVGIDNWSQFNGPKKEFFDMLESYKGRSDVVVIDDDCFSVDVSKFHDKFNVYFYDGDHVREAQEKAFTYFDSTFDKKFVAIIDDYKDRDVIEGTKSAFKKLNYATLFQAEFHVPPDVEDAIGWWNGMGIFVLAKTNFPWE